MDRSGGGAVIANTTRDYAVMALRAALRAAAEILEVYRGGRDSGVELKDDRSPVTTADMRAHRCICDFLESAAPSIPIVSEEAAHESYDRRRRWTRFWLVDPLDGTKEFIKRNGEFTINIALVDDGPEDSGGPVAGVVYAPLLHRAYVGVVGLGAWRVDLVPGEREQPATWDQLMAHAVKLPLEEGARSARPFTVVASRSHMNRETERFIEELRREHPDLRLILSGSALKLCLVAEGAADLYPRFGSSKEWDTAAGDAVCRAAGACVNEWPARTPLRYNKRRLENPWFLAGRGAERGVRC